MPNHRIAHKVKLMGLGSGPAQRSAEKVAAEAIPEPTQMVVVVAAEAVGAMAWAATDGPFAFRCRVDLAERRVARGRKGMRPSPTAPEEAHTSHSGSGWRVERASAASRENELSTSLHRSGGEELRAQSRNPQIDRQKPDNHRSQPEGEKKFRWALLIKTGFTNSTGSTNRPVDVVS